MSDLAVTPAAAEKPIITVEQHILAEQRQHFPEAHGQFSWLLSGLTLATKMIQAKVHRAGLLDILGEAGQTNVQGETQQKLDVYANHAVHYCIGVSSSVHALISEENETPVTFDHDESHTKYIVVVDPLDGSSNIDVNVSVGTTFSILRRPEGEEARGHSKGALQPGHKQVAAGYVLYGSSTVLVYAAGHGVHGFTLDPAVGAYVLSHDDVKMPEQGDIYSVNEAYIDDFPERYGRYIQALRQGDFGRRYKSRYVGSMVADFHRTLLVGGVFLYPPTAKDKQGKLRLLYEANPIALIAEQAGGVATDGERRILDIEPDSIHQRTPLVVGGRAEMERFAATV